MKNNITATQYCKKVFDGTHETPKPVKDGYPLVTSKNIVGGKLNLNDIYNISKEDYFSIQKRSSVSQWDILFSMIGSVGEIYLEKNIDIPYAIKNVGVFSCQDEYKSKWLYYYFKSPEARKFISNFLNGAVQKFLPLGTLRNFPVKPYKSSGGKMVWNEELKREVPEGWEVKKIGEVATVRAGGDKPKRFSLEKTENCSIPIFSNGITNAGLYGFTNKAVINSQSVTISAWGTIGYSILRNKPFVPIIRLIVVTPNVSGTVKFFDEYIKNLEFEKSGSVQQQLTVPQVSNLTILHPPAAILKKFETTTSPIVKEIDILKEQNLKLSTLRDWLLPMLMNGQVRVEEKIKECI